MTWIVTILCGILCAFGGILYGIHRQKVSTKVVGGLIVDKGSPHVNGGVYMVWDMDPMSLSNGEIVKMEVTIADVAKMARSQQEQGI